MDSDPLVHVWHENYYEQETEGGQEPEFGLYGAGLV
jgi:hypothetical protein